MDFGDGSQEGSTWDVLAFQEQEEESLVGLNVGCGSRCTWCLVNGGWELQVMLTKKTPKKWADLFV